MNNLKFLTAILLFLFTNNFLQAQCSDIHFYRFNGLQSDKPVYLIHDGERVATVRMGDRYKATVCTSGDYEFVVKTNEDNLSLVKTNLTVEDGKSYYIKIGCMIGTEVAIIGKKSSSKGKKDFGKGSKFKGAVQNITIKSASNSNEPIVSGGGGSGGRRNTTNGFQKSQVVSNFQFDITDIVKAGEMVSISMKVTNLSNDDLTLFTSYYNIYFYDDLGNLLSANNLCLINKCDNNNYTITQTYKQAKSRTKAVIPYGIPVNMSFNVRNIRNGSKKFVRGVLQFGSYPESNRSSKKYFELHLEDIVFPEVVDAGNPLKRNFGSNSMELISAQRTGEDVAVHYKFQNNKPESIAVKIEGTTFYDNLGNAHNQMDVAYGSKQQSVGRYSHTISGSSQIDVFVLFKKVPSNASEIKRVKMQLNGFTLDWENVKITGPGSTATSGSKPRTNQPKSAYINYSDFETKVRNNEDVVGTKVILERIYFESGSDEILRSSYSQLNKLAQLMQPRDKVNVEVSGHTDNVGDDMNNMLLSQKRADAIKYYLMGKSIAPNRISSVGKGKNDPIGDNGTARGRKDNRRVEILIVK